ncbi:hypothetical protein [Fuerstiella marisgermanici]|uniref:Uncharacterized protein n=1 Tax=Fuerstiella marisgermanici TaxID=1891926 RepID=A0A1P8W9N5_9PLAN|nr:hypothetical protein [Fuerstiella marisgermanici]APZ90776.1 hypothetical protein Fuma_00360 [Fuerstiella marisgermanici]
MSHPCLLDPILSVVDHHLDDLRKWNLGGLQRELNTLQTTLTERPPKQQTAAWLDTLASRDHSLVDFLLSPQITYVPEVAEEVRKILSTSPTAEVDRGPSFGQVAADVELDGQVVNSTVPRLRQRIQALTAALVPETPDESKVAETLQSINKPTTQV